MSVILLDDAKRFLRVTHNEDDVTLQDQLNAAEREARNFMDREFLPTVDDPEFSSENDSETDPVSESQTASDGSAEVEPDVRLAVFLLLKASYDGADAHAVRGALDLPAYRARAETLLMPYRRHLGV